MKKIDILQNSELFVNSKNILEEKHVYVIEIKLLHDEPNSEICDQIGFMVWWLRNMF